MPSILSLCRQSIIKLGSLRLSRPPPASNEAFLRTVKSIAKRGEVSSLAVEQLRNIANESFHLGAAMTSDFPDYKRTSFEQGGFRQLHIQLCAAQGKVDWMRGGDCRNLLNEQLHALRTELDAATTHWEGKLRSALSAKDSFRELTARAVLGEQHAPPTLVPPQPRVPRPFPVTRETVDWNDLCEKTAQGASSLLVHRAKQTVTTETWEKAVTLSVASPADTLTFDST